MRAPCWAIYFKPIKVQYSPGKTNVHANRTRSGPTSSRGSAKPKPAKISQADMLASLKEQIVLLSSSKGYSVAEIKAALSSVGVTVTTNAIADMVATRKRAPARKKTETSKTDAPEA